MSLLLFKKMNDMQFTAFSAEDEDGFRLAVFFTGFDTAEQVSEFLENLSSVWDAPFIHEPPAREQ